MLNLFKPVALRIATPRASALPRLARSLSVAPPKIPKKKTQLSALRRANQKESHESRSVILSLLTKSASRQVEPGELQQYLRPVTAVTIGESIDLAVVAEALARRGVDVVSVFDNEVLVYKNEAAGAEPADVMVLSNGTVVAWGATEPQMAAQVLGHVTAAVGDRHAPELEEMDYVEVGGSTASLFMQGDVLVVQGDDGQRRLLEMAAFAVGLSRLTRLLALEEVLERYVAITRKNSETMSHGRRVEASEADILQLTGQLFLLRGKLNLYLELIETPDIYWLEPSLEKIYDLVSRRLDIALRIAIMNRKLDYVTEEQRALLSVMNEKKSTRLEWIIIVLIMVEVAFETVHFGEHYWGRARDAAVVT